MTPSCGILTLLASSSSNSNRNDLKLSAAAFDICLELLLSFRKVLLATDCLTSAFQLLSISVFLHEFHGAKPSLAEPPHTETIVE